MSLHDHFSFVEVCAVLSCTFEDVRRWVLEDRKLIALRVDRDGNVFPFSATHGLHVFDVQDDGSLTDRSRGGVAAGYLRFEKKDIFQLLVERARAEAVAVQLDEVPVVTDPAPDLDQRTRFDSSLLATRSDLLDAFGQWGLRAVWFDDLNSRKWLLAARRVKGQGQRGHVTEPLFCPYLVMRGLITGVQKKSRLAPAPAWRTLAHKFPKVYAEFESHDPRDSTGD